MRGTIILATSLRTCEQACLRQRHHPALRHDSFPADHDLPQQLLSLQLHQLLAQARREQQIAIRRETMLRCLAGCFLGWLPSMLCYAVIE